MMLNLRKISLLGLLLSCSLTSIGSPICVASSTEAHRILMTKNPFSEASTATPPTQTQSNPRTATITNSQASAQTVNINQADAATLARVLSGVGEKKAQAIIEYRKTHGMFATVDDLDRVKGIGPATIEKNRTRIRLQ